MTTKENLSAVIEYNVNIKNYNTTVVNLNKQFIKNATYQLNLAQTGRYSLVFHYLSTFFSNLICFNKQRKIEWYNVITNE